MIVDIPFLGNLVLCLALLSAASTFVISVGAGRGRAGWLTSARMSTYATCALIALTVCLLAYAFQTHDFRIRYVARYSDRSMPWWYLVTSLWGGQDGSLLWWSFLLCGYTFFCLRYMKNRYLQLQPWVIATLMSILAFFILLMLFAANPFSTFIANTPADGEGLNPLLQNYWMTIHPPTLYLGFVGWSVPFAFVVAALVTGRLDDEWVRATRRWSLTAWLFLSVGLILGMVWSYEELGWGGYWAWDPVENASFMPWLVGTAYIHSAMIQERYGMLKGWNVFLLCLTFFMTIFGTFLTRSGMIASVHSFARSDIGIWFVGYMIILVLFCFVMIMARQKKFQSKHQIESLLSREFAFLFNNWLFLAVMVLVLVLTTYPLITEFLQGEQATVGPAVYNHLIIPFGLVLLVLMGIGPLLSWRKATGKNLRKAFTKPLGFSVIVGVLHTFFGEGIGLAPSVDVEPIFDTTSGSVLAAIASQGPILSSTFCAFVLGTIFQEFWRGTRARMKNKNENVRTAFFTLMDRSRRRYGGYIVHTGIALMYLGYTGAAYDIEKEATLNLGETMQIGRYTIRYDKPRMEVDNAKRMIFADLTLLNEAGEEIGTSSPAKFIYHTHKEMPTTEVAIRSRPREDLYLIMSTIDPETKRGTFRAIVRPLVSWIWFGGVLLLLGGFLALTPTVRQLLQELSSNRDKTERTSGAPSAQKLTLFALIFSGACLLSVIPSEAWGQMEGTSSLHAGTVEMKSPEERKLFKRLLCQCGECQRLPLDSCGCGWAEQKRAEIRDQMSVGQTSSDIISQYREKHGMGSIAVPEDKGLGRAMWAGPILLSVLAIGVVFWVGRRWRKVPSKASNTEKQDTPNADAYDRELDEALRKFDE